MIELTGWFFLEWFSRIEFVLLTSRKFISGGPCVCESSDILCNTKHMWNKRDVDLVCEFITLMLCIYNCVFGIWLLNVYKCLIGKWLMVRDIESYAKAKNYEVEDMCQCRYIQEW